MGRRDKALYGGTRAELGKHKENLNYHQQIVIFKSSKKQRKGDPALCFISMTQ